MTAFIEEHRGRFGVEPICRVMEFNPSTYWAARSRPPSERAVRDERLKPEIERVHKDNYGVYGGHKVWKQLNREGIGVARCTVARLMRDLGLRGVRRGKTCRTTVPDETALRPADLVCRLFAATRPDELWVADFERHEALFNRAVVKGRRLRSVAAGRKKLRAAGLAGTGQPGGKQP